MFSFFAKKVPQLLPKTCFKPYKKIEFSTMNFRLNVAFIVVSYFFK